MSTARATDYVITPEAAGVAGCVSYWRASGDINIDALATAWAAAGLDPKLLRKAPEDVTALRRAVMQQQDRHRLVRSVGKGAWAIVDEHVVEPVAGQPAQAPTYTTLVIVRYDPLTLPKYRVNTVDASATGALEIQAAVDRGFRSQLGVFAPEDVTSWLVALAYKQGAVTLRDSGGVYFIPRPSMDFWTRAADVVEAVSGKGHQVFRIPAMRNSEAVAAIVDAIQAEAAKVAETMEAEMLATGDDQLGKRAVKTRQADVEALLGKLADYETLLGLQLDVRSRVEALQANLAAAALIALPGEAVAS
jgi:hypothetical protein